ncbi:SusC/RagA family TonB-linked outer membrane protein [Chitinophaga agrisoli]|nr:TonB-dependent receptor [Chitinophaga agrisoli]
MKLTTVLLLAGFLQVSASGYAQQVKLTGKQLSLQELFRQIERQTGYSFLYEKSIAKDSKPINIDLASAPLPDMLEHYLKDLSLTYKFFDNKIIAVKEKEAAKAADNVSPPPPPAISISGHVTDDKGNPIPGVSVQVKGTSKGTVTNADGSYTLANVDEGATLLFSYIGYTSQELPVKGKNTLNVQLMPGLNALNETVVIGYGVQRKSDLTGAVSSVSGETLHERPASTVNQVLGGRIPGVNVTSNTGRPGGETSIRIRGNTSISITNNPLYVIDGIILNVSNLANGSNPIDFINPNDIASVEVLKDASATAIYGARGANGVILVTTKRGNKNGGNVSYSTDFSLGQLARKQRLLNSKEFLHVEDVAYQNAQKFDPTGWAAGKYVDPKTKRTDPRLFDENGNPLYDTDWQDETTRNAVSQNHQLAFTGGNGKDNYGVFLGYRNENGIVMESFLKRYSARFVFDGHFKDWLKYGGSLSYNDQKENQVDVQGAGNIHSMRQLVEELPIIPVHYPDGGWGGNVDYPGMEGGPSPVNIITNRTFYVKTQNILGNVYTNITLAKGLELRTTVGVNTINQETDLYSSRDLYRVSLNQSGIATVTNRRDNSWQFENYLTYNRKFNEVHSLTGLLGVAWQHINSFNVTANAQNFSDDYYQYNNLGAGATLIAPSSGASAYGLNSYFARVNYGFMNKYLFTFTGRIDGSSKFGEANRYAVFPSAAVAWKASEEEFIKDIPTISNLKVRASYGVTGNSELTAYQALAGLGNYSYIFNGVRATGVGLGVLANPALRWEKTSQLDAGIELGLFKDRVNLELDVYRKLTNNMLLSAPLPPSSAFSTIFKNVGSMRNQGLEFAINTINVSAKNFTWSTTFNIAINKNKVLALAGGSDIFPGSGQVVRVGYPVGSFYGYVNLGTWGTKEEAEAAKYLKKPGDIKYQDVNNDGVINTNDQVIIGKGIPDGFGTFLNTFSYRNFDLTLDLQYMYGNDVLNVTALTGEDRQGIANSYATVLDAWTPDHQNTHIAQWRPVTAGYDTKLDSWKVKDGSFIRGRNLLLAYRFPKETLDRLHISRLRIYGGVENFFLITQYKGYDPEVSTSGQSFAQGIVNNDYPKARTFRIGLDIGL